MFVTTSIAELRDFLSRRRLLGTRIGLVPTMGALHDGHLALMRACRETCDIVVATIFVNPTQFGPSEDLSRYPRTLENDLERCQAEGVDLVFTPGNDEMYPGPTFLGITINTLAEHLCGASRPGHFNGVLQVVNKLFNIVQPTDAWFGQKDLQQFILIETMVREFNIPVQLHRGETVRESDGLALSSRNRYLSAEERALAPLFPQALQEIVRQLRQTTATSPDVSAIITPPTATSAETANPTAPTATSAETANPTASRATSADSTNPAAPTATSAETSETSPLVSLDEVLHTAARGLEAKGLKIDYLTVTEYRTLQPVSDVKRGHTYVLAGAVYLGKTRLIDNIIFQH